MKKSEFKRIKQKICDLDFSRWWGDDYDVRFYLIHKLKIHKNKKILDIGGGIGIILSELDSTNFRINLDLSLTDLIKCHTKTDSKIENICASMTHLPFVDNIFDIVICANILEVAKSNDINSNNLKINNSITEYPTVDLILENAYGSLKNNSILYVTTPNEKYFKGNKMNYNELKNTLKNYFTQISLWNYNSFPRLYKKNRKLNLANIIPKFMSKIFTDKTIFRILLNDDSGFEKYSVWFYIEAKKFLK